MTDRNTPNGFQSLLKSQKQRNASQRVSKSSLRKINKENDENVEHHRYVQLLSNTVKNMQAATEMNHMIAEHNIALALCHKINVLFCVQTTFVNAEKLAKELWTATLGGQQPVFQQVLSSRVIFSL